MEALPGFSRQLAGCALLMLLMGCGGGAAPHQ